MEATVPKRMPATAPNDGISSILIFHWPCLNECCCIMRLEQFREVVGKIQVFSLQECLPRVPPFQHTRFLKESWCPWRSGSVCDCKCNVPLKCTINNQNVWVIYIFKNIIL